MKKLDSYRLIQGDRRIAPIGVKDATGKAKGLLLVSGFVSLIIASVMATVWLESRTEDALVGGGMAKVWIGVEKASGRLVRIELEPSGTGLFGNVRSGGVCIGKISRWTSWRGWIEIDVKESEDGSCRGRNLLGTVVEGRLRLYERFIEDNEVGMIELSLRSEEDLIDRLKRLWLAMELKGQ